MLSCGSCSRHDQMITRRSLHLLCFWLYLSFDCHEVCGFASHRWLTTPTSITPVTNSFRFRTTTARSTVSDPTKTGVGVSTATAAAETFTEIWTADKLIDFARQKGVQVSISTLGPGFRVVGRALTTVPPPGAASSSSALTKAIDEDDNDASILLGYVEGFARGSILHLDKMQVYASKVKLADQTCPGFDRMGGTVFGVGMLLGYLALLHGREQKCRTAELLAIDDEDFQHRRLVRYYRRGGFEVVRYVGEEWKDIPDRLVWGGCGTLMAKNVDQLLILWTQILQRGSSNTAQQQ